MIQPHVSQIQTLFSILEDPEKKVPKPPLDR